MDNKSDRIYEVIILGAGISGLGSAYNLLQNKTQIFDLVDVSNQLYGSIFVDILQDGFSAVYSFFNPYEKKKRTWKAFNIRVNFILTI